MTNKMNFEGKKVDFNALIDAIKEYGSYPIFQFEDNYFRMRVLPIDYTKYEDGSIGFGLNGGSLDRKAPQMDVLRINKDALIMEVDEELFPTDLQAHVKSVKTFFIESHSEGYYLMAYFPKHMIKNADIPTGKISARVKQILGR